MEILQYLHSTQCLVVKVGAEDIGKQSRSFRIEIRTADGRVQVASTYGAVHLAGSHPHAQGRVRFDCIPR